MRILIAFLEIRKKEIKSCFLKKIFLLANFSIIVILAIYLLNLKNLKVNVWEKALLMNLFLHKSHCSYGKIGVNIKKN